MGCNKCKKKKCGCGDHGLHTHTPCAQNTPACPAPEECSETFSGECIVYTGDTIVDANIQFGDRFNEIVQKLTLMILNPTCMDFVTPGTCLSPLNLRSNGITSNGITVNWDATSTAVNYVLEYKLASALSFTATPSIALSAYPTAMVSALTPNTDYHIRIFGTCISGGCYSLTILVRTKP